MLKFERTNEVMDFEAQFPKRHIVADAKSISLSSKPGVNTHEAVDAPSHTEGAISASSIYTLSNPSLDYYYNDVIGFDDLHDALVYESQETMFSENRELSQTLLKNELGQSAFEAASPRRLKEGQTLFAPEPSQITALYYRLADQLSDRLSVNELNLVNNKHGYLSEYGKGNSYLRNLNFSTLQLNDYFAPFFDILYRTCVNDNVLVQIRSSYENAYQSPSEITVQSSASASNHLNISSLRQARGFMHGVTWLMFTTAMNNILAAARSVSLANWSAKLVDELVPSSMTVFEEPDPELQEAVDDFERLNSDISEWIESLLISRRATLSTHPRYSRLNSPEGCITFFEAHRWVDVRAGEIYFESKHLITTATVLMFSGYIDQVVPSINQDGSLKRFEVADEWASSRYLVSAVSNCKKLGDIIEDNEGIKRAFERSVLENHRHFYPPSALI